MGMAICHFGLDEMKKGLDQTLYAYLQGSEETFGLIGVKINLLP